MTVDSSRSARDVVRVRDLLISPPHRQRMLVGAELREALTELYELWLSDHARESGVAGGGIALVAVGALGRRDVMPYSDLDLVLLCDGVRPAKLERVSERLWYPMWDAGIGLDHSVRTVPQALKVAGTDLRTALGLLEARHLAGDEELSQRLVVEARKQWRTTIRRRADELAESTKQRWSTAGEVSGRAEPDLKHGRGGLRDTQVLSALSIAQLVDRPSAEVVAARDFLADVRTELHRSAGRARDVVRAQDGDEVASALRLGDKFDLARALSGAGRTIGYAVDVALRAATPRRGVVVRRPLDDGVVLHGNEVALAKQAAPRSDPGLLLRVAAASASAGVPIAQGTLDTLADRAPEPPTPWPASVLRELLALLGSGDGAADAVEELDRKGLWGRLFPEWGWVRDLPPRDAPHVYTVDRHLIQTCVRASALVTDVSRPDLLLLGALVHDIGKGRGEDHSVVGARLATQIGRRVGLNDADVATLSQMVRHHLLLPHTATRRDVTDPVTVQRIARTVGDDVVLLELLTALAQADSLATGPGVWTQWKASLIAELAAGTRTAIVHDVVAPQQQMRAPELERQARESGRTQLSIDGAGELTVVTSDRPGVLSRVAGVLVLAGLRVHAATVAARDGLALLAFTVSPRFGALPDAAMLREQLRVAESGSVPLAERIAAKERDYARGPRVNVVPRILWFGDEASGGAVLEVRAQDAIGLLYRMTAAVERAGVDIRWARASTLGPTAVNSFCLVDDVAGGQPHDVSPQRRDAIGKLVTAALRTETVTTVGNRRARKATE